MSEEKTKRRLAAIMAADVVGYSRMMAKDESGTLAELKQHRQNAFDPAVARYGGRIVKLMGDGTLVEFASVVDAVNCAVALQQAAAGSAIVLRIGINLGDVIIEGDDIYGDGVNIAARLEPLATVGGLCISSIVKESIGDRVDVPFRDGGEVRVKNIDRPLKTWHWHPDDAVGVLGQAAGSAPASRPPAPTSMADAPSIAVLPFENMSDDAEQEYFSDGISEDIITDLSKVSGVSVIARNSSFAYRGKSADLRSIARELNVGTILEGSVRRAGNRVRITAQLVDAASGGHLWADRYDRDLTDIFAVQDEVTLKIVEALKVTLSPSERVEIAGVGTTSLEAHESYMRMRGLLFFPGMGAELWRYATDQGERAVALDPEYADAYGMLAIMRVLDFHNNWSGDGGESALSCAEGLAARAMKIDPDGVVPNHATAVVARWRGNYDLAASAIGKALAKSPDLSLGLFTRSEVLMAKGHLTEAVRDLERAIRLDPRFAHQYLQFLGMSHFMLKNYETAAMMFRERLILAKDTDIGRAWLAATLGHTGEAEEAREIWKGLQQINPDFDFETRLSHLAFADPSHLTNVLEGLTKAGVQI